MNKELFNQYLENVRKDYKELLDEYPFSEIIILPTSTPYQIIIKCVAANKELVHTMNARKEDFLGEYDKFLYIEVPFDYRINGCKVYGGKWLDKSINVSDKHFYVNSKHDSLYKLCVGVPESFRNLKNVILESVRTAENMLIAYELLQSGRKEKLELKVYEHGDRGREQYRKDSKRYK